MTQRLHILFLCGWFPSRVFPTNGDFIERHAKAVARKHTVSILHIVSDKNLRKKTEITTKKEENITIYIAYIKKTNNKLQKLTLFIKAFILLKREIGLVDLVHLNEIYPFGIFSLYLKWLYQKPFLISEHWAGYYKPQSKNISFFQKSISKLITKNATFVCPVSSNLQNSMLAFGLKGNYKIVPNVIETQLFIPSEKKEKEFTILHISNLFDTSKNCTGMLKVAKELEKK
ncbi:MAG: glycosyltransferase, partial [Polaribacter sp.]